MRWDDAQGSCAVTSKLGGMIAGDSKNHKAPRRRRVLLFVLTAAAGLALAFISWLLRSVDEWWSNLLANTAVVVLLLIPGELLLTGMRRRVDRVESTATEAAAAAAHAQQSADATARTLEEIKQKLIDQQLAELEDDLAVYRNITNDLRHGTLHAALRKATDDGLISPEGVRVPVWETDVHYRFTIDIPTPGCLTVQLEEDDCHILSTVVWEPETLPEDFLQTLVHAVRDAGRDLGTGLNLPTQSVEELASMLTDVTQLRSQELAGHRDALRKIIERRNGWYFTEKNVIPAEHLYYRVAVTRLNELDWEEHLRDKGWYSAPDAIQFARRLYGVNTPQPRQEQVVPDAKAPIQENKVTDT